MHLSVVNTILTIKFQANYYFILLIKQTTKENMGHAKKIILFAIPFTNYRNVSLALSLCVCVNQRQESF